MPARSPIPALFAAAILLAAPFGFACEATAQSSPPREAMSEAMLSEAMNANTVSVITGTAGGTYFRIGADLAFVLNDGDRIRVLPILGKGAGENAYDLRFLKGIDLAFLRTDTIEQLRQDKRLRNIEHHIQYVAKLFDDELHVIAAKEIDDVRGLAGKRVSFDVKGSGTDYSGRAMFRGLGIEVKPFNVDQPTAFEMLKKGEIDAVISVAAKPVSIVAGFDPGDRFHLVRVPYAEAISEAYVPATLTSADYPKLVDGTKPVETLAVGTILGAYNHPKGSERYRKLERFVDAFFGQFDKFLTQQRHAKWREVNLAASVAGWTRFRPAQDWLDAHQEEAPPRDDIARFLSEQSQDMQANKEQIYQAYLNWRRARNTAQGSARR
ncbi:hypothetical protein OPKNFCMD_6291 [Methylobacterium crusticola]|uniref:Transporter n=1 Tax=Methylobacterium crusticola TaxID=1697972 RepID=A0ABQ4R9G8_9HYPH|nr:TAXI family TRAP transporter solute-binding subunit [Methylobacterium crusticola]GJD53515.1 hypothetical protein OPKNFCMD_6291 [Methylobacterium crusticola]